MLESTEIYDVLFEHSVLPMWIVDLDTAQILAVNSLAVQTYGYQRETFLGSDLRLLRPNDSVLIIVEDYRRFAREGGLHPRRHRQADGQWVNVQVAVHSFQFEGREAGLAQVLHAGIGKTVEEEVRRIKERLSVVLTGCLDAVVSIDRESRIIEWSGESEAIFGWTAEEAIGQFMHQLLMPERYRDAHLRGLTHYFVTGQPKILGQRVSVHALRKSGEEFPVDLRIQRVDRASAFDFTAFIRDMSQPPGDEPDVAF